MPSETTAADIMRRKLVSFRPDTPVMDAVASLLEHAISGAPVLDDERRLAGILSELDCASHLVQCIMFSEPAGIVGDLMTKDVETVPPDCTLLTLAHHFKERRVRRLPVVDEHNRLLGQVSRRDLMRALFEKAKPRHRRGPKPLYLSAVYGTEDLPADLDPSSPSKS